MSIFVLLLEFGALSLFKSENGSVSTLIASLFILLFSMAFLLELNNSRSMRGVATPLALGYFFRIALVYFDIYGRNIYHLPNSGADTEMFYHGARYYMNGILTRDHFFIKVMGTLFRFIGTNRVYAQFLLSLLAIASIILMIKALQMIGVNGRALYNAAMIVCLLPNFAILSSIFLRESVVVFFISLSLYMFVRWFAKGNELFFLLAFACCFAAAAFHSGSVAIAGGYILVRLLYDVKNKRFDLNIRSVVIAVAFLLVFTYLYNNFGDVLFSKMTSVESIEDIANENERGGSSYVQYVGDSSNPLNMLIYTIPRIFFFMFSPLPGMWRDLSDIIAFCFSSLYYFIVIVKALKARKIAGSRYGMLISALLLVAGASMFVFGWGCSNTGTATRHREKLVILFSLINAVSLYVRNGTQNIRFRRNNQYR